MIYVIYILAGLAGGVLTGMAGLTAAMVLTPILCGACGWAAYDATTIALIANVPSAMVTSWTFYKNGNMDIKRGMPVAIVSFLGAVVGSYLGYLFSQASENGISYIVIVSNLFMAVKFFMPSRKKENLTAAEEKKAKAKGVLALILGFIIGIECGFMGSAGGVLMLMVLTMMLGMETKLAVGTSSLVMMLVALTGAVSHVAMGAEMELLPSIVMTVACTVGAVGSSRFANKVEEKTLNRAAGVVLLLVSVISLVLSK
ncbi:MAG: sulfite exporter TauE/SafE family protein [Oscillospiraceae bacterium]|nr:sulfite exporter TauE/SafE family protein [Oscillospiraceae bacterium]